MPFNISSSINYMGDKTASIPIIRKIAENPIYTAFIIAIVIMLIITVVFRNVENDEPLYIMSIRAGFWVFLFTIFIIFLHDKILSTENTDQSVSGQYRELFNDKNFSLTDKMTIPSSPVEPTSILKKEASYDISSSYED